MENIFFSPEEIEKIENQSFVDDQEYVDAMNEYFEELTIHRENEKRINDRILKAVEKLKGKDWFEDLKHYMKDAELCGTFSITRKPKGTFQKEGYEHLPGVWVDQYTGYECDDYYGTVSVQLKENRWLEMPFSC
ncbi:hypothetical protein [Flavobacterium sp.]|uniref:hypothetical protein n=1 Tax=Flavobacterium sp. TaxID=239 RepID=UPI003D6ACB7E